MKKKISDFNMESEKQSKVENIELRGSGLWCIKYKSLRVLFFKGRVTKGALFVKLPLKNQAIINNKKRQFVWNS